MNVHTHFLFPLFFGLLLYDFGYVSFSLAFLAAFTGMFVDVDHYIEHILHAKKDRFSLKATWNNSIKLHRFEQRSFVHHSEGAFWVTLFLLILFFYYPPVSLALTLGYYSHLFLDDLHLKREKFVRGTMAMLYLKESHFEVVLDVLLILGIVVLLLI